MLRATRPQHVDVLYYKNTWRDFETQWLGDHNCWAVSADAVAGCDQIYLVWAVQIGSNRIPSSLARDILCEHSNC